MPDADLYQLHEPPTAGSRPVLLHSLTGFLDAGSAGRLAVGHLLDTLDHRLVATFDIDGLYDYRSRRPRMTFLTDHYGQIDLPELTVHEVTDRAGARVLLLHGPEPDTGWRRFAASVVSLVRELDVSLTIGLHAVPWPAPHTRPIGVTAHANESALLEGRQSWVGELQVPGHCAGLIELALREARQPAMGFAAHVPHYVSAAEYPRAAIALLDEAIATTGLDVSLDALREAAARTDAEIDAQVASAAENADAVQALEAQYDAFAEHRGLPLFGGDGALPTGDDIAAQVEQFLAQRETGGPDQVS